MKKIITTLISILTVTLLISSATAVPNTNSETIINKINNFEKFTTIISNLKEKIENQRDIKQEIKNIQSNSQDKCILIITLIRFIIFLVILVLNIDWTSIYIAFYNILYGILTFFECAIISFFVAVGLVILIATSPFWAPPLIILLLLFIIWILLVAY